MKDYITFSFKADMLLTAVSLIWRVLKHLIFYRGNNIEDILRYLCVSLLSSFVVYSILLFLYHFDFLETLYIKSSSYIYRETGIHLESNVFFAILVLSLKHFVRMLIGNSIGHLLFVSDTLSTLHLYESSR